MWIDLLHILPPREYGFCYNCAKLLVISVWIPPSTEHPRLFSRRWFNYAKPSTPSINAFIQVALRMHFPTNYNVYDNNNWTQLNNKIFPNWLPISMWKFVSQRKIWRIQLDLNIQFLLRHEQKHYQRPHQLHFSVIILV